MCRGDIAVTCNSSGDDYDMVSCPNGCDAAGCIPPPEQVDCTTNAECTNPAPICSVEMTCRGCQVDGECASSVCNLATGACVAESAVVYASAAGSTTSSCTLANPCSLDRAITEATSGAGGKTLRLLPGAEYTTDITIRGNTILPIVASGASASSKLIVQGGASVEVRDLSLTSTASGNVTCGDTIVGEVPSALALRNVVGARLSIAKCNFRMSGGTAAALFTTNDASVEADRVVFSYPFSTISGQRVQVSIKNSVLMGSTNLGTSDTVAPPSKLTVAFSTFVFPASSQQTCDVSTSYMRSEVFENNIFYSLGGVTSVVFPRNCSFENNIMFPQGTAIANNVVLDPELVDAPGGNYHLKTTSPAKNAGVPSVNLTTDHDFDGVMRPQGNAPDIGAFELVP